jgi:Putative zinc-finger
MQDSNQKTPQPGHLTHPSREDWMAYLYGELPRANKLSLAAHLRRCPQCETQVEQWLSTMKNLDAWKLPVRPGVLDAVRSRMFQPAVKWAAAAAIVLALGFGAGRISSLASGHIEVVRASLQSELDRKIEAARVDLAAQFQRQQVEALNQVVAESASVPPWRQEMERLVRELAKSIEERRTVDAESMTAALQELDNKWTAWHAALRKELETVAVLTEDGFNDTQQKLYQLANFTQTSVNK